MTQFCQYKIDILIFYISSLFIDKSQEKEKKEGICTNNLKTITDWIDNCAAI